MKLLEKYSTNFSFSNYIFFSELESLMSKILITKKIFSKISPKKDSTEYKEVWFIDEVGLVLYESYIFWRVSVSFFIICFNSFYL